MILKNEWEGESEFADEDRRLAEEGMSDYAKGLAKEDTP